MVTQEQDTTRNAKPYAILVADDDDGNRDGLARFLRLRGFATHTAACGEEAIDIVRADIVHCVVFDFHMPRMTGLEALQQVRLVNAIMPALLMTADANPTLLHQAQQAQVYSVLPKPVNSSLFLHLLERALKTVYS